MFAIAFWSTHQFRSIVDGGSGLIRRDPLLLLYVVRVVAVGYGCGILFGNAKLGLIVAIIAGLVLIAGDPAFIITQS